MDIVTLVFSLISGAVGGNVAGALMRDYSLGTAGNSIAGVVGGGVGGWVLGALGAAAAGGAGLTLASIVSSILSGGIGGAILMLLIGMVRDASAQP